MSRSPVDARRTSGLPDECPRQIAARITVEYSRGTKLCGSGLGCHYVHLALVLLPDLIPDAGGKVIGVDRQLVPHALDIFHRALAGCQVVPLASHALEGEERKN